MTELAGRTVVHLLRHGEVHNPTAVLYGRLPGFRLSELGQRQALTVAEHLRDNDITHVVASPLQRAQETARPISDSHRLELVTDQRLIEAVFAELEDRQPKGFTYKVFRLDDGVSFVHVVTEDDSEKPDSLQSVSAFQAFVADIGDRCDIPPVASGATVVGGYR